MAVRAALDPRVGTPRVSEPRTSNGLPVATAQRETTRKEKKVFSPQAEIRPHIREGEHMGDLGGPAKMGGDLTMVRIPNSGPVAVKQLTTKGKKQKVPELIGSHRTGEKSRKPDQPKRVRARHWGRHFPWTGRHRNAFAWVCPPFPSPSWLTSFELRQPISCVHSRRSGTPLSVGWDKCRLFIVESRGPLPFHLLTLPRIQTRPPAPRGGSG